MKLSELVREIKYLDIKYGEDFDIKSVTNNSLSNKKRCKSNYSHRRCGFYRRDNLPKSS